MPRPSIEGGNLTTLSKVIRLRKEDYGGVLIDKEQISFIEILTKHIITNININLNNVTLPLTDYWLPEPTDDPTLWHNLWYPRNYGSNWNIEEMLSFSFKNIKQHWRYLIEVINRERDIVYMYNIYIYILFFKGNKGPPQPKTDIFTLAEW